MKKFLLTIVCVIVALIAFAQNQSSGEEVAPTSSTLSVEVQDEGNLVVTMDSVGVTIPIAEKNPVDYDIPTLVTLSEDGSEFIIFKGAAYGITESIPNGFFDKYNRLPPRSSEDERTRQITKVVGFAIAFIVPCLTIIVALICLLVFWLKRSNSKNAIIAKAIDNGYDLPDAFYTGQSSQSSSPIYDTNMGYSSDNENGQTSRASFTPVPVGVRDPKMFTSSVSLIAVGLSLLLFFGFNGNEGVGFLCGGIPLFLGIGRLIAYLYIPGARESRSRKGQSIPPQQPYADQRSRNYPPRHFDGACPPPPPANDHSVPMNENHHM